jgi:phospholipid-binding lipoprotein MlaA
VLATGCATLPDGNADPHDPLEPVNRAVFDFNTALDDAVIRPVAQAYRDAVPAFVRDRIRGVMDNLAEPRIFVNDVLQGRFNAAGFTFARFVTNTTLGIAGMFDFAGMHGLPRQTGDFGQTLYAWGVDDGPYLVLLFFGPSNTRDAFGLGVDLATTPPAMIGHGDAAAAAKTAAGIVDGIDLRARNIETLSAIRESALDFYTHLKSLWRQHRAAQLRDVRAPAAEPADLVDPGDLVDPQAPSPR